jgi:ubiquinone/menaquinone biosynthesis C-methylase UbiE
MHKVEWDYTALASHYDKRADYADEAIDKMLSLANPDKGRPIADIGAGTGKLTKLLLARGFAVLAVEPNDAMRAIGVKNTEGGHATWSVGTGENTGLPSNSFDLVTFGSSFNVTDRARTLIEVARMLRDHGWFACMWNHRNLDDPLQAECERVISEAIPGYDYGTRREDQTAIIRASGLYEEPITIEGRVDNEITPEDFLIAWKSHATLQRQAGAMFDEIIGKLEQLVTDKEKVVVPYTTRIWVARKK